jgi:hypothetical protein
MKAITVATDVSGYFETLKESAIKYNYDLIVLGCGMKWKGFGWRLNITLDYLKTLPKDEIVIVIDAYDVIFLRDSIDLKEEFINMNVNFLCGAFRKLNGILGLLQEIEFGKSKIDLQPPYNNICAGTYISKVENILDIYQNYLIEDGDDDQILLNKIYDIKGKNLITPDSNFKIFCSLFPSFINRKIRSIDQISITSNHKLKCGVTSTYPYVLHGLANTDLTNIINRLGLKKYNNKTTFSYNFNKSFYHIKLIVYMCFQKLLSFCRF